MHLYGSTGLLSEFGIGEFHFTDREFTMARVELTNRRDAVRGLPQGGEHLGGVVADGRHDAGSCDGNHRVRC